MEDPRIILAQELIEIGFQKNDAFTIALDAGSSQVVVNKKYLVDLKYQKNTIKKALELIAKFYSGELFEEIEADN